MKLNSDRLQTIASCVRQGSVFADVGTDHAHIPSFLINSGVSQRGFAGDIKKGPLRTAETNLIQNGALDRVKLILCDGLKAFPVNEINDIIIAGMGGDMIIEILREEKRIDQSHLLILQPMTQIHKLRRYLLENGYTIVREKLAKEDERIYNIIVARKEGSQTEASLKDVYFGVNVEETETVKDYIAFLLKKHRMHLNGLKAASKQNETEIRLTEDIVDMLEVL